MTSIQISHTEIQTFLNILSYHQINLQGFRTIHLLTFIHKILNYYKFNHTKDFFNTLQTNYDLVQNCKELLCYQQSEFFRDTSLWIQLKTQFRKLQQQNEINILFPRISTGEELYSLLIFLEEMNMLEKTNIVATEVCQNSLEQAKKGTYNLKTIQNLNKNWEEINISKPLTEYFEVAANLVNIKSYLKQKVNFHLQNIQNFYFADYSQYDIIWYRNQLIYWDVEAGNKHLTELTQKLKKGGMLILGYIEDLYTYPIYQNFEIISIEDKIYKRK
ncbi:MAG: hypothetical protein NZ455_03840 [Bacteroidia bacterium]|nr:hypothetical protein [Bacteroidia bacterium]MDW8345457.1 CheR family methyltransferase [Bacteroidia bacterium]